MRACVYSEIITKKFLIKEYLKNKKTTYEIANELNCSRKNICRYLKRYNIKARGYTFIKGHKHSSVVLNKISIKKRGIRCSPKTEFKKGFKPWNKGTVSQMVIPWNKGLKGTHFSLDTEFKKGNPPWNKGLYGKGNPNWQGGISFEPYSIEFNNKLKEQIRKRDNYTCQLCSRKQKDYDRKLAVHHIDYDKLNCKEENLVTLCQSCHIKTNYNRDYWRGYFYEFQKQNNPS